jgi:hypothetical protein
VCRSDTVTHAGKSAAHQSTTKLLVGRDVHKDSSAVAYAPDRRDARVVALGTIGTGQRDTCFREAAELIRPARDGPPDPAKMSDVFRRQGMTLAPQTGE